MAPLRAWTATVALDRFFLTDRKAMRLKIAEEIERDLLASNVEVRQMVVRPYLPGDLIVTVEAAGVARPLSLRAMEERRRTRTGARRGFLRRSGSGLR